MITSNVNHSGAFTSHTKNTLDAVAYNINPEYTDAGYKKGGKVKSASTRGDGCAKRGKTKGKMV